MIFNIASRIALGVTLCLLFTIIPQINIFGYVNPTVTSKFIYFMYICMVSLIIYGFTLVFKKEMIISFSMIDVLLLLLLLYISVNRYYIQSTYGFSIRYMELLGLSVVYMVLKSISIKNYGWLFLVIILSGSIQAVYGNLQLLDYYPSNHAGFKMTGSFFNPGPYAGFLASVWPLALGVYLFRKELLNKINLEQKPKFIKNIQIYLYEYIPLLGLVSITLVLPASQSRAAWLAVICSSVLLLELKYRYVKTLLSSVTSVKKITLGVIGLSLIVLSIFGIYQFKKGSSDGRLFIWKVTTNMIVDAPVFGVGFDRFKAHYMNYQADYFKEHGETSEALVADNSYYAFNEFLQFFAENGVIGFLLLVLLSYFLLKVKITKEDQVVYQVGISTLLTIGVFGLFSYPMQILPIKIVLIFTLSLMACLDMRAFQINFPNHAKTIYKTFGLVALGGIIFIGTIQMKYIKKLDQSFKIWQEALTIYNYGDYEGSLALFKQVKPVFYNDGDFLSNYGKTLAMANHNEKAVKVIKNAMQHVNTTVLQTTLGDAYKGLQQYSNAEKAYSMAYDMIPTRFYPLYLLANLYEESNQQEKASSMAETILSKEIKIPSTAIKEIQAEMKKILKK